MKRVSQSLHAFNATIDAAQPESSELYSVRRLWRAHSGTLGFFPDGAFREHAARGWILVAKSETGEVLGYLLYRVARARAVVVHLCTADSHQRRGLAQQLIRAFRARTTHLLGARLTCRLDFPASSLWSRLGFVRIGSRPARESGKSLGIWQMDYGHPDLFSRLADECVLAVMDANVFFDIADGDDSHRSLQAQALTADWLQTFFTLAVTPELHNEISRNPDDRDQRRLRGLAATFIQVKAPPDQVEEAWVAVTALLGPGHSESDRSDRRQLAHAIASGARLFVTCDQELLDRAAELEAGFSVKVVEPVALINDIDASEQPFAYAPARLEGSGLHGRRMRTEDLEAVKRAFLYFGQSETVAGLPRVLLELLAQPRTARVDLISDGDGRPVAVLAIERATTAQLRIRALRARKDALGQTVARHLLWRAVNDAKEEGASSVSFSDQFTDENIRDALSATGFIPDTAGWSKLLVRGIVGPEALASRVRDLGDVVSLSPELQTDLQEAVGVVTNGSGADIVRLEHLLWPLKVNTDALPCYIVPIRPVYAAALFDTTMAAESLFEAESNLLLRLENVYYRAPRPMIEYPSRVLWYVSAKGKGYSRARCISAASTITSVVVGAPKSLFAAFRRYGIYRYDDVRRIGDTAMAFTFAQTELLTAPVTFERIMSVLQSHLGSENPLAGPVKVPAEVWFDLYTTGAARSL